MRILHTADWHLGKRLEDISRMQEQKEVLDEICWIADEQKVDAVLIAGDLFDTYNPPIEAEELFYKTVKRLAANGSRPVVAIAGNHDSPDRIAAPDPLARECGIFLAGYPNSELPEFKLESGLCLSKSAPGFAEFIIPGVSYPLRILLTPYSNEFRLRTYLGDKDGEAEMRNILQAQWQSLADAYCDGKGVNVLMAHLFLLKKGENPPEEPDDEKPILHIGGAQAVYSENVPKQIQYVALGHLHRHQQMDNQPCPMVYSSSPLSYSFSEAHQEKYVVIVEAGPGKPVSYSTIPLASGKRLYRKKFDDVDEAVAWLNDNPHSLVELTIVTENYLTGADRKRLVLPNVVTIIPQITNPELLETAGAAIDLNKDMDTLFADYFTHRHGQPPNGELLDLFKEIRAEEDEE